MRRTVTILTAALIVVTLAACSAPAGKNVPTEAAPTAAAPSPTVEEAAPSPTESVTPEQTPVPEPTMSEMQIAAKPRYDALFSDCERYQDFSAALIIKEMYDNGEVSQVQYDALYAVFDYIKDYDEQTWTTTKEWMKKQSDIINGRLETISKEDEESFVSMISVTPQQGIVNVNLFDTDEKIERVKKAVDSIDKWCIQPTSENLEMLEELFWSKDLTPGEIVLLENYMYYNKNLPQMMQHGEVTVDTVEFMSARGFFEYEEDAYKKLIKMNNTPESKKDWLP